MKDVTATFSKGKGKHGAKETSTESYAKTLERKFVSMVGGTPKWAELRKDRDEDADSDDEFFRVRVFNFVTFWYAPSLPNVIGFLVLKTRTLIQL